MGSRGWSYRRLVRRLLSTVWEGLTHLSLVQQPELMIWRAAAAAEAEPPPPVPAETQAVAPVPAGPPPGHPERLTGYLPSAAELELWRQLDDLVP